LNIWRCAMYRLKGELSMLFSHLTITRCEPHVWRGRYQIDNTALPTVVAVCHREQQPQPQWCSASDHRYQNFERFLSIHTQDMNLTSVVFVKYIFECVYFFLNNPVRYLATAIEIILILRNVGIISAVASQTDCAVAVPLSAASFCYWPRHFIHWESWRKLQKFPTDHKLLISSLLYSLGLSCDSKCLSLRDIKMMEQRKFEY
jgi:hypothetical protein